jgi:hypothetical protein
MFSKLRIAAIGPKGSLTTTSASSGTCDQHRGRKEVALRADALTAGEHLGAFGAGVLHDGLHGRQAALVGQWPHLCACRHAITHLQRLRLRGKCFSKSIGNFVVHQKAGG